MSIRIRTLIVSALAFGCGANVTFAASPSVTAVLSNSQPSVNEPVELQIKVTGAKHATVPGSIPVDGVEIQKTGQSWESHFSFGFDNSDSSSSVIYHYTVLPLRAGQFKIPPQTVRIGSDSLKTPELTLSVTRPSGGKSTTSNVATGSGIKPWAQLTLVKNQVYVGQPIEAQIEIGLDARIRVDPQTIQVGPEISPPGFVVRRAEQIQQVPRIVNGVTQRVFIYKAAITPAKSGHFEISAKLNTQIQVPISRSRVPRMRRPTDPVQELFDEMEQMMPDVDRYSDVTPLEITSDPVVIDVKPLPPNAPPNFSGAVGNFTMTVDAKPKTVQVGDPITVTSTINGRGNFDRMNGPALEDEHGWHKYPPSSKFRQDDDVGVSGEKTFEMVLAPNEKKSSVPPLVFAYFDPAKENYITLRSDAVPIQVEGGAAPGPSVAAVPANAAPSATAAPGVAAPTAKPQDILYQMTELGRVRAFTPIYARPIFWIVQLLPLILFLGFLSWKIRQANIDNREARRVAALQQESTELLRKLRRSELSPQEYFSNASRVVRVKTALAKNINPNAVDAETAAKAFALGESDRAQLRTLFERSDELRFSGSGNGAQKISSAEREEVLRLLESLRA
jgi:BatD DUF11 like domain